MVCSERPSEPKASQQARLRSNPCCCAASCTTRSVSRSLRWLTNSVSERADKPCAISVRARRRMSGAAATSSCRSAASRSRLPSRRADKRCSANRSRSETIATTRPSSVTGTWRRPWRDISSTASCTLCAASSVCTGWVIRRSIGVSIDGCASATRSSTSCRVKMPTAATAASSTSTEPTRRCCIKRNTSSSGVLARQLTRARRGRLPSGASIDSSASACAAKTDCCACLDNASTCCTRPCRKSASSAQRCASWCIASAGTSRQKQSSMAM